ncbi:hypothetical protein, partial [Lancefieldella parvula]|uniref:hypothetical protein n=1 Tax=Lancefieldella parvula TaxID=1382 RepID=UPI0028D473BB
KTTLAKIAYVKPQKTTLAKIAYVKPQKTTLATILLPFFLLVRNDVVEWQFTMRLFYIAWRFGVPCDKPSDGDCLTRAMITINGSIHY